MVSVVIRYKCGKAVEWDDAGRAESTGSSMNATLVVAKMSEKATRSA
jgi:hypothetical protein